MSPKQTDCSVANPGKRHGGPAPRPFIFRPKGLKKFFDTAPPPLPQGLDDRPPPPYLKVWICHCDATVINSQVLLYLATYLSSSGIFSLIVSVQFSKRLVFCHSVAGRFHTRATLNYWNKPFACRKKKQLQPYVPLVALR